MPAMLIQNSHETASVFIVRQLLANRSLSTRALEFVSAAAEASSLDVRHQRLANALEIVTVLLNIDADDETCAASLIAASIPRNAIDSVIVSEAFGADVWDLVNGVLRAGRIDAISAQSGSAAGNTGLETLRKMLLALADDVRVVLIKLAERVTYMRSITKADDVVRRAAAQQTRDLFAPLANRLGVFQIKWELEDFSFRYLEPELYKRIASLLDGKRTEREAYIDRVLGLLREEMDKLGIQGELAGRPKHIFSIHRKMQSKNVAFERLYDIRAIRVLVDTVENCYAVLGLAHDIWQPIQGEFDDYIAQPKANNYQSLHTAVIGPEEKTLEVQIRTREMHIASEHGVAAHWRYKEGTGHKTAADKKFESKIAWLRQVLEWKRELVDQVGFSEQIKQGLFNDTIYVFTPQGKVVDLPTGSTPVDFAYHVHTDLGHRCRGAKLDGQIVPLNTKLQNAQRVEILAAKIGGPSRDWINPQLGFLSSHRALAKVRAWFRQEYFEVDVAHGRQAVERELARAGATALALEKVTVALGHKELDECLAAIGRNEITSHQIEVAIRELRELPVPKSVVAIETNNLPVLAANVSHATSNASSGVVVLGVNNIATMVAKCCKPVPPDPIIGFVTKTRGVTVHRVDCVNITSLNPEQKERLMPAEWGNTGEQPFLADFELEAEDRQGLLRDVSEALSHERVNVVGVNTQSRGNRASMRFTVEVRLAEHLQRVLRAVSDVRGVETVRRR
ncbi:MAG: bifunctional (p)ppGpp synthetase/guanosine-3',5'-bis(diphosphate) 3'-pyrophosphohydrolase [Burkholderiales bacterium]|nr:bifunctional (p)ppGpp synthetase/guanosine-3',5'-bis(diphosphate) 3'-pyrophosphohydrolase [Burkholderiales bacterium]